MEKKAARLNKKQSKVKQKSQDISVVSRSNLFENEPSASDDEHIETELSVEEEPLYHEMTPRNSQGSSSSAAMDVDRIQDVTNQSVEPETRVASDDAKDVNLCKVIDELSVVKIDLQHLLHNFESKYYDPNIVNAIKQLSCAVIQCQQDLVALGQESLPNDLVALQDGRIVINLQSANDVMSRGGYERKTAAVVEAVRDDPVIRTVAPSKAKNVYCRTSNKTELFPHSGVFINTAAYQDILSVGAGQSSKLVRALVLAFYSEGELSTMSACGTRKHPGIPRKILRAMTAFVIEHSVSDDQKPTSSTVIELINKKCCHYRSKVLQQEKPKVVRSRKEKTVKRKDAVESNTSSAVSLQSSSTMQQEVSATVTLSAENSVSPKGAGSKQCAPSTTHGVNLPKTYETLMPPFQYSQWYPSAAPMFGYHPNYSPYPPMHSAIQSTADSMQKEM